MELVAFLRNFNWTLGCVNTPSKHTYFIPVNQPRPTLATVYPGWSQPAPVREAAPVREQPRPVDLQWQPDLPPWARTIRGAVMVQGKHLHVGDKVHFSAYASEWQLLERIDESHWWAKSAYASDGLAFRGVFSELIVPVRWYVVVRVATWTLGTKTAALLHDAKLKAAQV